jgi:DNA-binding response OmpR family regulator
MRILVIDDDQDLAEVLAEVLGDSDHQVSVAHTCAEALANASTGMPHLVLVDYNLPDCSGLDLTRQLRTSEGGIRPRIVVMTGEEPAQVKDAAAQAGVDEVVRKPMATGVIEAVLMRAASSAG